MRISRALEGEQAAAVKRPPIRFGMLAEESIKRRRSPEESDGGGAGGRKEAGGVTVKKEDPGKAMDIDVEAQAGGLRELAGLGYETEERIMADLSRRVTLSKGALPSVCCYTIFNSKEMVHSIDISDDASTGSAPCPIRPCQMPERQSPPVCPVRPSLSLSRTSLPPPLLSVEPLSMLVAYPIPCLT